MTKEEAIACLKRLKLDTDVCLVGAEIDAVDMAIEALKAPTENTNTPTDLISRNKALNLVLDVCDDVMDGCETVTGICGEEVYTDIREVDAILKCNKRIRNGIRRLPSAEPTLRERALMLLLNWAVECDFGYDNFPEEYERYKDEIEDMDYFDGMIYIAEKEVERNG